MSARTCVLLVVVEISLRLGQCHIHNSWTLSDVNDVYELRWTVSQLLCCVLLLNSQPCLFHVVIDWQNPHFCVS